MMVIRQYYFEVYERHAETAKKLGRLINGWLAVRLALVIAAAVNVFLQAGLFTLAGPIIGAAICFALASAVKKGDRASAWALLAFGALGLVLDTYNSLPFFSYDLKAWFLLYLISWLFASALQIAAMLYVLVNKDVRAYCDDVAEAKRRAGLAPIILSVEQK